uniref:Sema domain-containing protein n=1 Tax=Macrostomum lignano TaxID=282301 RepID=A0A1I8J3D9_9PLAT
MTKFIFASMLLIVGYLAKPSACKYPVSSHRYFSYSELSSSIATLEISNQSLVLVAEMANQFYLGAINAVFEVPFADLTARRQVLSWPDSDGPSLQVEYLYFANSTRAFACARESASSPPICRLFIVISNGPWQPIGDRLRDMISAILAPSWLEPPPEWRDGGAGLGVQRQRRRVSLGLPDGSGGLSRMFISEFARFPDSLHLVELLTPGYDRIGRISADGYSRRSRELWISKSATPLALGTVAERLYALYTEPALELDNYCGSVNGPDAFAAPDGQAIKLPRFTRLGRVCLNDPGLPAPFMPSTRVLTSFFKLRLICRNGSYDYDVLGERLTGDS